MNDYWEHQEVINCDNYRCIFNDIKTRIRDIFKIFFTNINNNARLEKCCIFKTEFVYEEYLKDDMSSLIWIYQEKSLFQNIHFSFFIPIGSLNAISFYPKIVINKITIFRTKWKWNNI